MSDDRLITAIGRIERALTRIESRSLLLPSSPRGLADADLEQRHRELRQRTEAVIERLDRLIEGPGARDAQTLAASC